MIPGYENSEADPAMVSRLTQAITLAIETAAIPEVTSTADVISAIFTTLDHTLTVIQNAQSQEDELYNSREISRVLTDMLFKFGAAPIKH